MTLTLIVYTFLIAAAIALTVCARRFRQYEREHPLGRHDPPSHARLVERPYNWQEGEQDG